MTHSQNTKPSFAELIFERAKPRILVLLRSIGTRITANRLFWLIACIYVGVQFFAALPLVKNYAPVGGDDGYSYIYRAAQLDECPLQDCPALNDLREQLLLPTDNLESAAIRNRQFTRLLVLAHPLYALLLLIFSKLANSLEIGYDVLFTLTKLFIPIFIAYWLKALYGKRAATVALLLLTPILFLSHGFTLGVPSVLAIGLACLLWGLILEQRPAVHLLFIPLATLILLTHSMGLIYVGISALLYAALSPSELPKNRAVNILVAILLCTASVLLPMIIDRPTLEFSTVAFYPGNWSYLKELTGSLDMYAAVLRDASLYLPTLTILLPLCWIGITTISKRHGLKVLLSGISVFLLMLFGSLYVVPWYGGFTFVRLWPLTAVFLFGLFATGLLAVQKALKVQTSKSTYLIATALGVTILFSLFSTFTRNVTSYLQVQQGYLQQPDTYFNPETVAILGHQAAGEKILYMDEVGMYYFLSHGGLQTGAVYYPALQRTDDQHLLQDAMPYLSYVVQRNPLYSTSIPLSTFAGIALEGDVQLILRNTHGFQDEWEVYVDELSKPAILQFASDFESRFVSLPPGEARWVVVPEELEGAQSIYVTPSDGTVSIGGVRPSGIQTQWLWDAGIELEYVTADTRNYFSFDSALLTENMLDSVEVVEDFGYLVVAEVTSMP